MEIKINAKENEVAEKLAKAKEIARQFAGEACVQDRFIVITCCPSQPADILGLLYKAFGVGNCIRQN